MADSPTPSSSVSSALPTKTFPSPPPPEVSAQPSNSNSTSTSNPPPSETPSSTQATTVPAIEPEAEAAPATNSPTPTAAPERAESTTSNTNGNAPRTRPSQSPQANDPNIVLESVRKALPSNLDGRVDGRNGKFAVMHMGTSQPAMDARSLAAKRSSEIVVARSQAANKDGYRPPRRTAFIPPNLRHNWLAPTTKGFPPSGQTNAAHTYRLPGPSHVPLAPAPPPPPPPPQPLPTRPGLSPAETKSEQARLLTLLRSLHPVLVVDQLCKAVAYFGGIPSAPAPADGVFPHSVFTNGSGSLFISWCSEIFPPVDSAAPNLSPATAIPPIGNANPAPAPVPAPAPANIHRGRGRPKGSKSKYQRRNDRISPPEPASNPVMNPETPSSFQPPTSQQPVFPAPPPQPGDSQIGVAQTQNPVQAIPRIGPSTQGTNSPLTPIRRGRGRPKGSKNRPKSLPMTAVDGSTILPHSSNEQATGSSVDSSPLAHRSGGTQAPATVNTTQSSQPSQPSQPSQELPGPGSTKDHPVDLSQTAVGSTHDDQTSTTQAIQSSQPTVDNTTATSPVTSRKRKDPPSSQPANQEELQTNQSSQASDTAYAPSSVDAPLPATATRAPLPGSQPAKRLRTSIGADTNHIDSQPPADVPSVSPNPPAAAKPTSPTATRAGVRPTLQQEGQQMQRQRQSQNVSPTQATQAQVSPQIPQVSTQSSPQTTNWQRNQAQRPQPRPQNARNAQAYFQQQQQQRQMPNQYGQAGNANERYGRSTPTGQFQQAMLNPSPSGLTNQQPPRPPQQSSQQPQQPQQSQQPQHEPASSSQNANQFQGYSGSNYMDMDYSAGNFNEQTQLEAALAEPGMRETLYQAISRQ